ncbi:MAG: DNA primase large subunit PriL [Thermofilum sp.]
MTSEQLRVILSSEDYARYPFLPEALNHLRELGLTLEDLSSTSLGAIILSKAKDRLARVIESSTYPLPDEDYRAEIATFYASLLILAGISDQRLTEKFAIAYSKNVHLFLKQEVEKGNFSKLFYIARHLLGWRVRQVGEGVMVHFSDYVQAQPEYVGPWKLVNRLVDRGYVFISWQELARLLETGVRKYVVSLVRDVNVPTSLPENVYKAVEEISAAWSSRQHDLRAIARTVYSEKKEGMLPPCMRELLRKQSSGENLSHSARFALASFLISIGLSVDEVLDLFRSSPDFREDIARYQVEHIAGLRGSRVKYSPYKCDNMRSLGLCRWECEKVSHPLQYFYRAARGRVPSSRELW